MLRIRQGDLTDHEQFQAGKYRECRLGGVLCGYIREPEDAWDGFPEMVMTILQDTNTTLPYWELDGTQALLLMAEGVLIPANEVEIV